MVMADLERGAVYSYTELVEAMAKVYGSRSTQNYWRVLKRAMNAGAFHKVARGSYQFLGVLRQEALPGFEAIAPPPIPLKPRKGKGKDTQAQILASLDALHQRLDFLERHLRGEAS